MLNDPKTLSTIKTIGLVLSSASWNGNVLAQCVKAEMPTSVMTVVQSFMHLSGAHGREKDDHCKRSR
jgi:hypothetical protein